MLEAAPAALETAGASTDPVPAELEAYTDHAGSAGAARWRRRQTTEAASLPELQATAL